MSDYELNPIAELIEKVRATPESDAERTVRLLRLNALFVYFQYAVASVRLQEENTDKMAEGQHRNFATHAEYADCLLKIYSSAITTYSFLRTCLNFILALIDDIPSQTQSAAFKKFRVRHRAWAKNLINKRDKIAAHPEKRNSLVWKPSGWHSDGRTWIVARNLDVPE